MKQLYLLIIQYLLLFGLASWSYVFKCVNIFEFKCTFIYDAVSLFFMKSMARLLTRDRFYVRQVCFMHSLLHTFYDAQCRGEHFVSPQFSFKTCPTRQNSLQKRIFCHFCLTYRCSLESKLLLCLHKQHVLILTLNP